MATWIYLPGAEGDDTVDIGENHHTLITELLEHTQQGMNFSDFIINGINSNKGDKDTLHSKQNNVPGGTPKKFFSTDGYNTQSLDFVVQRVVGAEIESYYIYTFEDDALNGTVGSTWVPAYRVLVQADGVVDRRTQYVEKSIQKGKALLYKPKGYSFLSIDPLSWVQTFNE